MQTNFPHPVGESKPRLDVLEKVTGAAITPMIFNLVLDCFTPGSNAAPTRTQRSSRLIIRKLKPFLVSKLSSPERIFPKRFGLYLVDKHIFAREKVLFIGQPVAAVAAISEDIAEKALDLIDVEYEELEAVFDPVYGASPEAPLLHPDMAEYEVPNYIFPQEGTNIANHFKIRKGDVEGAWKDCCRDRGIRILYPACAACAHRAACGCCQI